MIRKHLPDLQKKFCSPFWPHSLKEGEGREREERKEKRGKNALSHLSLSLSLSSVVVGERRKIIALPSLVISTLPSVIAAAAWTARSRRCVAREAQKKDRGKVDWFDPEESVIRQ
jgi:hypothetical protein